MIKWVRRNIYKVNDIVGYYYGSLSRVCKKINGVTDYLYRIQQMGDGVWQVFEYSPSLDAYFVRPGGNHPTVPDAFKTLKDAKDYMENGY